MMNSSLLLERFLQNYRFNMVKPYLKGNVLDFGGNYGELGKYVSGRYLVVNYDHTAMNNKCFDIIIALAVIEHIHPDEVNLIFKKFKLILNKKGKIILTTPTRRAKLLLKAFALIGVLDKGAVAEHKHYWTKKELYIMAKRAGFVVTKYIKFQLGFNQFAILEHLE